MVFHLAQITVQMLAAIQRQIIVVQVSRQAAQTHMEFTYLPPWLVQLAIQSPMQATLLRMDLLHMASI
jgi:hypothetical protein